MARNLVIYEICPLLTFALNVNKYLTRAYNNATCVNKMIIHIHT